jgi:exosortase/archaeosortase family protein
MAIEQLLGKSGSDKKHLIRFFISLILICSVWFFVYILLLRPNRVIDRPLTNFITLCSAELINFFSPAGSPLTTWVTDPRIYRGAMLFQNGKKIFGIWDICNGLDLMFIYSAVIILLPNILGRKVAFLILGNILLVFANILRIVSLYFIFRIRPDLFDFSHHYLFTLVMYVLIFCGWILFIKNRLHEKAP